MKGKDLTERIYKRMKNDLMLGKIAMRCSMSRRWPIDMTAAARLYARPRGGWSWRAI